MECQIRVSARSNCKPRRPLTLHSYIWFGSNAILFIYTFFFVPETRDRTLEEIHEMFEAKLPARKFKGYVCTGTAAMHNANADKEVDVQELESTSQAGDADKGNSTARTAQV
jgi:hypothetical protein